MFYLESFLLDLQVFGIKIGRLLRYFHRPFPVASLCGVAFEIEVSYSLVVFFARFMFLAS